MNTQELIDALDQRYGNPLAKDCELIQEAIKHLQYLLDDRAGWQMSYENCHRTCNGYGMN